MSDLPVKDAVSAITYARKTMALAGLTFYFITSAKRVNGLWRVEANNLGNKISIKINAKTGEIIEYTSE